MRLFGAFLALAILATCASAQFGGGFGGAPEASPVKTDLPYIRCGVCEALAKHAFRQVKAAKDALKPGKKVGISLLQHATFGMFPRYHHGLVKRGSKARTSAELMPDPKLID